MVYRIKKKEALLYLGISRVKLESLMKENKIKYYKTGETKQSSVYFYIEDLNAYIDKYTHKAKKEI